MNIDDRPTTDDRPTDLRVHSHIFRKISNVAITMNALQATTEKNAVICGNNILQAYDTQCQFGCCFGAAVSAMHAGTFTST